MGQLTASIEAVCFSFYGLSLAITILSLCACFIILCPRKRLYHPLGVTRFIGLRIPLPSHIRFDHSKVGNLPYLPVARRHKGKLIIGALECLPAPANRWARIRWTSTRFSDAHLLRQVNIATNDAAQPFHASHSYPAHELQAISIQLPCGRRTTVHIERARMVDMSMHDLLVEPGVLEESLIDHCHLRLATTPVSINHSLAKYKGETVHVLFRVRGGVRGQGTSRDTTATASSSSSRRPAFSTSKAWKNQKSRGDAEAQAWCQKTFSDGLPCVRKDPKHIDDVPVRFVALFQFLIDNRWNLANAMINSVVLESCEAWEAMQEPRYQSYLRAIGLTTKGRQVKLKAVQMMWELFLGESPTSTELGKKTYWGAMSGARQWVLQRAAKTGSFVIPSAHHRFNLNDDRCAAFIPLMIGQWCIAKTARLDPRTNDDAARSATPSADATFDDTQDDHEPLGTLDEEMTDDPQEPEIEFDPARDDTEVAVERIFQSWQKRMSESTNKLGKRLPDTKIWTMHRFPPKFPTSSGGVDKTALLEVLRKRLIDTAWHDGRRGFTTDKKLLEHHVDLFIGAYLADKSLIQLQIIEALPELHITPEVLQSAGLVHKQLDREEHCLYFKCVRGSPDVLSRIVDSARPYTAKRAQDFRTFLAHGSNFEHVHRLGQPPRSTAQTCFYHVGRLSQGVEARREHERREQNSFKPEKGGRFWAEAVAYCGGSSQIEYWRLSSADLLFGQAWVDHMRWGELLFACLLANPGITNFSWPGIDCPPPPIQPGGSINVANTKVARVVQGRRLEGQLMRRSLQELYQYSVDHVSALCLLRMDYNLMFHPADYLRDLPVRFERSCQAVVFNTNESFDLPVVVTERRDGVVIFGLLRLFAAHIDSEKQAITLRPASVSSQPGGTEVSPIDLRDKLFIRSSPGYFEQALKNNYKILQVRLVPFPLADPDASPVRWTLQAASDATLPFAGAGGPKTGSTDSYRLYEQEVQIEAAELLLGRGMDKQMEVEDLQRSDGFVAHLWNGPRVKNGDIPAAILDRDPLPRHLLLEFQSLKIEEESAAQDFQAKCDALDGQTASPLTMDPDIQANLNALTRHGRARLAVAEFQKRYEGSYILTDDA